MHEKHIHESYKAWITQQPCVRCEAPPPSDPHHAIFQGWGQATRNDYMLLPLCRRCHSILEWPNMTLKRWLDNMKLPEIWIAEKVAMLLVRYFGVEDNDERPF